MYSMYTLVLAKLIKRGHIELTAQNRGHFTNIKPKILMVSETLDFGIVLKIKQFTQDEKNHIDAELCGKMPADYLNNMNYYFKHITVLNGRAKKHTDTLDKLTLSPETFNVLNESLKNVTNDKQIYEQFLRNYIPTGKRIAEWLFGIDVNNLSESADPDMLEFKLMKRKINERYTLIGELINDSPDNSFSLYELEMIDRETGEKSGVLPMLLD